MSAARAVPLCVGYTVKVPNLFFNENNDGRSLVVHNVILFTIKTNKRCFNTTA